MFKYVIFALAVGTAYAAPASSPEPSKLESAEKSALLPSLSPEPSLPLAPIAASPLASSPLAVAPLPDASLPAAPLPAAPLLVAPASSSTLEPLPLSKKVPLSSTLEASVARSAAYARRYLVEPLRSPLSPIPVVGPIVAPDVIVPLTLPKLSYPELLVPAPGGVYTIQEYGYKINH